MTVDVMRSGIRSRLQLPDPSNMKISSLSASLARGKVYLALFTQGSLFEKIKFRVNKFAFKYFHYVNIFC